MSALALTVQQEWHVAWGARQLGGWGHRSLTTWLSWGRRGVWWWSVVVLWSGAVVVGAGCMSETHKKLLEKLPTE